jgi:hypothetical protein
VSAAAAIKVVRLPHAVGLPLSSYATEGAAVVPDRSAAGAASTRWRRAARPSSRTTFPLALAAGF